VAPRALIVLALVACGEAKQAPAPEPTVYRHPEPAFSLTFPPGWTVERPARESDLDDSMVMGWADGKLRATVTWRETDDAAAHLATWAQLRKVAPQGGRAEAKDESALAVGKFLIECASAGTEVCKSLQPK
jgi:hypothetical protein